MTMDEAPAALAPLPVTELPGVGYATRQKLERAGLATCGDVQRVGLADIQRVLGEADDDGGGRNAPPASLTAVQYCCPGRTLVLSRATLSPAV